MVLKLVTNISQTTGTRSSKLTDIVGLLTIHLPSINVIHIDNASFPRLTVEF